MMAVVFTVGCRHLNALYWWIHPGELLTLKNHAEMYSLDMEGPAL